MKKGKFVGILLLLIISLNLFLITMNNDYNQPKNQGEMPQLQIDIDPSDVLVKFTDNTSIDSYFSGNGTDGESWATAHVLNDTTFIGTSTSTGINFRDTTEYVIIRNCTFRNFPIDNARQS